MDINNAKVHAILRAIKITLCSSNRLQYKTFLIESDSLNAVSWSNSPQYGPWNLNFQLNFIRNALKTNGLFSISHHVRSSNYVADALAKQGMRKQDEFWLGYEILSGERLIFRASGYRRIKVFTVY